MLRVQRICNRMSTLLPNLFADDESPAEALRKMRDHGMRGVARTGYLRDASERADFLRELGEVFPEHEAAGCPPVLFHDYDTDMEGPQVRIRARTQLIQ